MIFVTIGTQEPFERLIKAMDNIAAALNTEVVAQVFKSSCEINHMKKIEFLSPTEFEDLFDKADLIVSHAGMGTIISAIQKQKNIIVMPRLAQLGEHRNEHQTATAQKMSELGYIEVANSEEELGQIVRSHVSGDVKAKYDRKIGEFASKKLINSIKEFIKH